MDQQAKDAVYEAKLARLRAAIQEGLDIGPAEEFDLDALIAEMHALHPE
ncbi:type II toxin-antitoxin system ParD family antitoxin [Caulobacter segnis]|nr:type II toxin-antitoxin system ParD family antitoxin [Caulobacter segnis]MDR6623994.1 Arc/MetJ-type ribon-helix-helix transcriptional regulator [Caulobacter segnis]